MIKSKLRDHTHCLIALSGMSILLAGCAVSRAPIVTINGIPPASGLIDAPIEAPTKWRQIVIGRLMQRGFSPSPDSHYILQVTLANRPAFIGLRQPGGADGGWIRPPNSRAKKKWTATLGVTIHERLTGREVYRASASILEGPKLTDASILRLIDAILPNDRSSGNGLKA